jgi:hypothetical protein
MQHNHREVEMSLEQLMQALEKVEENQKEHTLWCGCITGVDLFGQEVTLCCERHLGND